MLLKSVLDDHPTGGALSGFVLEFLCDMHEQRVFTPGVRAPHALEQLALLGSEMPIAIQLRSILGPRAQARQQRERERAPDPVQVDGGADRGSA